jgi:hypothetical protein
LIHLLWPWSDDLSCYLSHFTILNPSHLSFAGRGDRGTRKQQFDKYNVSETQTGWFRTR